MAHTSYKLTWLKHLMQDFDVSLPMNMYCDNQTTNPIACPERTKHIEIDCKRQGHNGDIAPTLY